ncbi:hypothetical protein [Endozoicomonas numazuensis]|uniref:Uncharacterized protein n=1 Tax=Endozoicomonas numazuensis TaxID=1137799 RepID=A0A081NIC9_9GAMM|nr:hypothetical protein [Endozoicomonas numazuensis]KEQ18202.1 hypothetical protein GZ78_11730 [Endozoicomonas numazuensis]
MNKKKSICCGLSLLLLSAILHAQPFYCRQCNQFLAGNNCRLHQGGSIQFLPELSLFLAYQPPSGSDEPPILDLSQGNISFQDMQQAVHQSGFEGWEPSVQVVSAPAQGVDQISVKDTRLKNHLLRSRKATLREIRKQLKQILPKDDFTGHNRREFLAVSLNQNQWVYIHLGFEQDAMLLWLDGHDLAHSFDNYGEVYFLLVELLHSMGLNAVFHFSIEATEGEVSEVSSNSGVGDSENGSVGTVSHADLSEDESDLSDLSDLESDVLESDD